MTTTITEVTIAELKQQLAASIAESKANPKPPYCRWEFHPQGNMRHRSWRAGESRRRSERRKLRRQIRLLNAKNAAARRAAKVAEFRVPAGNYGCHGIVQPKPTYATLDEAKAVAPAGSLARRNAIKAYLCSQREAKRAAKAAAASVKPLSGKGGEVDRILNSWMGFKS